MTIKLPEYFWKIPFFQNVKKKPKKRSFEMLTQKSGSLFNKRDVIKLYVVTELKKGKKPTSEYHKWLKEVVEIEKLVCELLESKQSDSQSKIPDELQVLEKVAEYLEKSPQNNGIIDAAMDERSERMKGSMVGCNVRTSEVEKTRKMQRKFDQLSSASLESSPGSKETDLKISMHQNADVEIMYGPSAAASERAQHYKKKKGYRGPESKISVLKEETVSALDLEVGKTSNKPDALATRETKSTSLGKSPLISTVAHSERSESGARQPMTETSSILEEASVTVSSEIKEIPPADEMKNFETERSIPEKESSVSELIVTFSSEMEEIPRTDEMNNFETERSVLEKESSVSEAKETSLKSEGISSKSGNKLNLIMAKLVPNFSRRRVPNRRPVISRSASRNEAFLGDPKLSSSRKHDTNLPEGEEEKTITCVVKKIMECLQDNKIRRIGIYGRGGIGKTTVLKALLSCPEIKDKFHSLIQVTVSRYWSKKKIQIEIARQIELSVEGFQSEVEVAGKIFDELQSRKFLLLLDDVWENINLEDVGIPCLSQQSHSRIILTTRSVHICKTMHADRQIEVAPMSQKEAWNLFQEQVGGIMESPDIRPCAEAIVSECGGLPLMIIVIGKALAKENDVFGWRHVRDKLLSVTELKSGDTEDHNETLLKKLKLGFDRLHGNGLKYCFLYCALYPEDQKIEITQLIKDWIKEGLVTGNSADALNEGNRIIRHLTKTSLVECVDGFSIQMHDMIRDLASWIMISEDNSHEFLVGRKLNNVGNPEQTSEGRIISQGDRLPKVFGSSAENLLVLSRAGAGLVSPPEEKEWEEAEMIFLMDNCISGLPENLKLSNLKRLFLQRNIRLTTIPESFFDTMHCLQVLNLSKTNIRSLPPSLFKLSRLQALFLCHCDCLSEIPRDIGNLALMEILNLDGTDIYSLPDSIGKLSLLKHLRVSFYAYLEADKFHKQPENLIPRRIISKLQALEELSITVGPGDTQWNTDADFIAQDLCSLSNLKTLYICFPDAKFLKTFIRSSPAWIADSLTKFKFVIGHEVKTSTSCVPKHTEIDYHQKDKCLRYVDTDDDHIPDEVKKVLKRATAFYLDHQFMISSLTEFGIDNIRQLNFCIVSECPQVVSVLHGVTKNDENALPNLSHLSLHYLRNLMNIWNGEIPAGSFNALKVLSVHTCPNLKFVLSWSMLPHLPSLEDLIVEDCATVTEIIKSEMKTEVGAAELAKRQSALPNLSRLSLHYLWDLMNIWNDEIPAGSFNALKVLSVHTCPKLKFVLSRSVLPHLPSLEELIVEDCATVTEIIKSEGPIEVGAAELPKLKRLELLHLPELVTVCNGSYRKIEHKIIQDCPKLKLTCCHEGGKSKEDETKDLVSTPSVLFCT